MPKLLSDLTDQEIFALEGARPEELAHILSNFDRYRKRLSKVKIKRVKKLPAKIAELGFYRGSRIFGKQKGQINLTPKQKYVGLRKKKN